MTEDNTPIVPDDDVVVPADDIVTPDGKTAVMEPVPADVVSPAPSLADDGTVVGTSESASRRKILVTIAVVAIIALIVGLAWATARDDKTQGTGDSADLEGSHQGTSTVSPMPSTTGTRTPGSPPNSSPNSSPMKPGQTAPTRPGVSPSTPPVERPTQPAPEGSKLATVTQPPEATLAMIEPDKLKDDARYTIVFNPYGYGPSRRGQPSLVVRITQATGTNESAKALDFTDRNLLASALTGKDPITLGGTYTGVLTFRPEGGLLIPVISEIKAKE